MISSNALGHDGSTTTGPRIAPALEENSNGSKNPWPVLRPIASASSSQLRR
jgi:hypothetical protein